MSSFTKWLSGLFDSAETAKAIEAGDYPEKKRAVLAIERVAIMTAVNYLSAAVAQSEFRTFLNGEEVKKKEYYLWNISPNKNQSSTQFLQDLVETLIYNNEVLIVERGSDMFIADGYARDEQGTKTDVFTGISVRGETFPDKKADKVLYLRMHNEDIRPLLSSLCNQYEAIITEAMEGYEKTNADKGILTIGTVKSTKIDHEKIQKDLLNNRFKDFFSSKNAVLPLYDGYSYTPHTRSVRNTSELTDIKTMSDEIYNRVGQAFRIPPTLLRGEVVNNETAMTQFLQLSVRPVCNMLSEEITRKRYGEAGYLSGSYVLVDSASVELGGVFSAAQRIDKLISCGVFSIDEVRAKLGEPVIGTPETQQHFITKNYGTIAEANADGTGKGGNE